MKTGSKLKIRIGQQVNGYFVDAVKAGATAAELISINGNYPPGNAAEEEEEKAAEAPATEAEPQAKE